MAAAAILDFQNREFYLLSVSGRTRRIIVPNFVKIGRSVAKILQFFLIFKMAATAILYFWNHEILLAIGVLRVETHQRAKSRQNRSIGFEDIKISRFFKMAAVRHLGFVWGHIWTTHCEYFGVSIIMQNLVMIAAVVFIIWTFQYLTRLAGKCLFTQPKLGLLGKFDPLNGLQYQPVPKWHTVAWVSVIWAIKRANVVNGLTCSGVA